MLGISTILTIYILVLGFFLGAALGSFINCASWRIVHGENWMTGRSHCATCNHPLGVLDLIPVFSYLFLRGRCRYCGEKISPRYMLTELGMGLLFVSTLLRYDVSTAAVRYMGLFVLLLGLSLVDLETYEIPDGFIISGIIWWVITLLFETDRIAAVKNGLLGGFGIAGGILIISLIFEAILKKEAMGGGDIKLYFMVGLFLSLPLGFFNLMVSCVVGLIFVVGLRQSKIPFGPAISLATVITIFAGQSVVNWYLSLF